ncbi:MAG: T9SS type A sorting domain-containing protein [Rhodothermales bacterium]|nr:T9SS type A sorting domain-containing protein [Rhodothermales bacterium]
MWCGHASGAQPAGTYEVSFDATGLQSGVYFYRLQAGDYVETKRMVVVR